jgi:hypothetical protein
MGARPSANGKGILTLWATTAFHFAIAVRIVGGSGRGLRVVLIIVSDVPSPVPERDVVGSGDPLVAPRHGGFENA